MLKMRYASLLFLLAFVVAGKVEEELPMEKATEIIQLKAGESGYYRAKIPSDIPNNQYFLIFDVFPPDGDNSDPDIFVSSVPIPLSSICRPRPSPRSKRASGSATPWARTSASFRARSFPPKRPSMPVSSSRYNTSSRLLRPRL